MKLLNNRNFRYESLLKSLITLVMVLFVTQSVSAINNGDTVSEFTLTNSKGESVSLSQFAGKPVILEWFNEECPFVVNHYKSRNMQDLQKKAVQGGAIWLTINSTSKNHRDFRSAERLQKTYERESLNSTHLLMDPDGEVGKMLSAKTTPHMFLLSEDFTILYQGAIDNQPSFDADPKKAENYILKALNEHKSGSPISTPQTDPYGCSVKYD